MVRTVMKRDTFKCTKFTNPCTMTVNSCLLRQQKIQDYMKNTTPYTVRAIPMSFLTCVDCKPGRRWLRLYGYILGLLRTTTKEKIEITSDYLICRTCSKEKYKDEFYEDKRYRSGRDRECKQCKITRGKRKESVIVYDTAGVLQ